MFEGVLPVVVLDCTDAVLEQDRPEVPQAGAAAGVEHADVRERATDHEVVEPAGVQPPLEFGVVEGVVGVFLDDVVRLADLEFVDDLGVPRPLEDVFAPLVELVVVVGVRELFGRVDVAGVDHLHVGLAGPGDEVGDRFDDGLAAGRVQRAVGVTEAVLHVHDHDCRAVWLEVHTCLDVGKRRQKRSRRLAPSDRSDRRTFQTRLRIGGYPLQMSTTLTRTRVLVGFLAIVAILAVVFAAGGMVPPLGSEDTPESTDDRTDEPTTEDTVGYVEGYWYDDELAVDDRDDAALEDDELESVVYRSMARVEEIRGLTFEEEVPVDVISREEFRAENDELFVELNDSERVEANTTYEALFMVDRETDAVAELEAMYGGAVEGYYEPSTDQVVVVSDTPESPELDEIVLGHELLHALQDQHYDLTSYDRETIDQDNAKNGLIEGDAVWVDTEYEDRCTDEWNCISPSDSEPAGSQDVNWGIYLTLFQPYSDGPDYVDHLLESGDGWAAVDAAYDDPPRSSSTVIHHEDREPVDVTVEDRSTGDWEPFEVGDAAATETVGEAGMVSMLGAGALDRTQPSVIDADELVGDDLEPHYDHPYTDGWAGDELAIYVDADAGATPTAADTGYVWETEWRSTEDAREFATGYLELLEIHDAEAVDDRRDTYVIDDGFPGAYFLERDGETVTVVHAPSVDDLDAVADGAGPDGEDAIERVDVEYDEDDGWLFGLLVPGGTVALPIAVALFVVHRWTRSSRTDEPRSAPPRSTNPSAVGPDPGTPSPDGPAATVGVPDGGPPRSTAL